MYGGNGRVWVIELSRGGTCDGDASLIYWRD